MPSPGFPASVVNANTDTVALALSNTISHEIGHVLGLVHDDVAAPHSWSGSTTVVQNTDLMRANVTCFTGYAGETVNFEIYSLGLEQTAGDTNSGRIANGNAIGASTLSLFPKATVAGNP